MIIFNIVVGRLFFINNDIGHEFCIFMMLPFPADVTVNVNILSNRVGIRQQFQVGNRKIQFLIVFLG